MHYVAQVLFQRPQPSPDAWRTVPLGVQPQFYPASYQLRSSFRTDSHIRWYTGPPAGQPSNAIFVPPLVMPTLPVYSQQLSSFRSLSSIRWFTADQPGPQYVSMQQPASPPMDGLLRSSFRQISSIRWYEPSQPQFFEQQILVLYQPAAEQLRQSFSTKTHWTWFDPMLVPAFFREVFVFHPEYQPGSLQLLHGLPQPTNRRWYTGSAAPFYIVAVEDSLDDGGWFPTYPSVIQTQYAATATGEQV